MRPLFSILLAILLISSTGCIAALRDSDRVTSYNFTPGKQVHGAFEFFNLTRSEYVWFEFEVGDGGKASACFLKQSGEKFWMDESLWPRTGAENERFACEMLQEEGSKGIWLKPGAYVFAIRGESCPAKDCRLKWGHDAPANSTITWTHPN